MSESELLGAYHASGEIWLGLLTIFISVLFAYLVAAYLVGSKLGRTQMAITTGIFTVLSSFLIFAMHGVTSRMSQLATEIREINPERIVPADSAISFLLSGIFLLAFLAGVVFMVQVRRSAREPEV
jgi:ABC-type transport system involved in cytochrome c biogenesis permease subunit